MKLEIVKIKKRKDGDYDCIFEYDKDFEMKLCKTLKLKSITQEQIKITIKQALCNAVKPNVEDVKLPKNWGVVKPICLTKKICKTSKKK